MATVAVDGTTEMEVTPGAAGVTRRVVEALTESIPAEILVAPEATAVARPELLIFATEALAEVQETELVRSLVLPSE